MKHKMDPANRVALAAAAVVALIIVAVVALGKSGDGFAIGAPASGYPDRVDHEYCRGVCAGDPLAVHHCVADCLAGPGRPCGGRAAAPPAATGGLVTNLHPRFPHPPANGNTVYR